MNSINKTARIAGFLYFMYIVTSFIANWFGRFVYVDASVTINQILTHASQFRIGFVISLFSVVFFLLAAWALYVLLKPVNENIALLFLLLNLGGFAIWCFSMLSLFASLMLLSGAEYLKVFQPDQLQALALLFVNLYKNGSVVAQAEGEHRQQAGVVVYAHQQTADSLKRRTIGSSRCCELLTECQQGQQAHETDHVKDRLNSPEDNGSECETCIPLVQDRIHHDGYAGTCEVPDDIEQGSCGHLVRIRRQAREVGRTREDRSEHPRQHRRQESRDSRNDENHACNHGNLSS